MSWNSASSIGLGALGAISAAIGIYQFGYSMAGDEQIRSCLADKDTLQNRLADAGSYIQEKQVEVENMNKNLISLNSKNKELFSEADKSKSEVEKLNMSISNLKSTLSNQIHVSADKEKIINKLRRKLSLYEKKENHIIVDDVKFYHRTDNGGYASGSERTPSAEFISKVYDQCNRNDHCLISAIDIAEDSGIPSFLLIDVSDKPIRLLQAASAIP
jgi:hypothetical protein